MRGLALDLGGTTVRAVTDEDPLRFPRAALFPGSDAAAFRASAAADPLAYDADDDEVLLRVQVFVVEAAGRTVLVDCGVGDGKERPARPSWHRRRTDFLDRLGVAPEDVDVVVLSHLHADHVGWATRPGDAGPVPTFPRARHLVAEVEFRHWAALDAEAPVGHGCLRDSVLPVVDAGLADLVPPDAPVTPGVRLVHLPGHTPGQVGVRLSGSRGELLLSIDALHHAAQVADPSIVSAFCADGPRAVATRLDLLAEAADGGLLLAPAHARGAPVWRVSRRGAGFAVADGRPGA
jgi:glyoxylase-like metal-dependent hydrolase (beta-lactamase superfamily II)